MAINFDGLVIDRVLNAVAETFDGELLYILNQLTGVKLNTSADSKDATDAVGTLIKRFYTAKKLEFSAETKLFSLSMAAEQFGSQKIFGTESAKLSVPRDIFIPKGVTEYTLPVGIKPETGTIRLASVDPNGTMSKRFEIGEVASATKFAYDSTSNKITLPTGVSQKCYLTFNHMSANSVRVDNRADKFPRTVRLKLSVLVCDPCSADTMRQAYIILPSFQVSPDCEIALDTDTTFAFSGVGQVDYCSDDKQLFYIIMSDDDIVAE